MIRLLRAMAIALLLVAGALAVASPVQAAGGASIGRATAVSGALLGSSPAVVRSLAVPQPDFTHAITSRLAAQLAQLRSVNHLPGLQVVIRYPDGAAWMGHAGFGDIAAHQAMGNLTLLDAGSITKTFVVALVLKLAGQGVLDLDDPIARWLPGLPYDTGITIRELLDHTSGVDDAFNHPALLAALDANHRRAWTAPQVLAYVGKAHFPPGQGIRSPTPTPTTSCSARSSNGPRERRWQRCCASASSFRSGSPIRTSRARSRSVAPSRTATSSPAPRAGR